VNDDQVREKLREAFRTFALPRVMPTPVPAPQLEGFEAITINGGRGRRCSACGEFIPSTAEGSFEFKYPDGRRFAFHDRCEQLWQEERHQARRP
jgi:hypothetical protein